MNMNGVHVGGDTLNPGVTSKQELIKAARKIATTHGISSISIRGVAAACGVSVGAIYNYFPTKADLVVAVIEDFWRAAFHGKIWTKKDQEKFPVFWSGVYDRFYDYLHTFQVDWLEQLSTLTFSEKEKAKGMEAVYFEHMKKGFLYMLEQDKTIPQSVWTESFTKEQFAEFSFANMMVLLRKEHKADKSFFCQVLECILYHSEK